VEDSERGEYSVTEEKPFSMQDEKELERKKYENRD
jgi:hypothetical protein